MKAWATKNIDDGSIDLYSLTDQTFLAEHHARRWNKLYAGKVEGLQGHVASKKKAIPVVITEVTEEEG